MSKMTNLKAFHVACKHIRSFILNFADIEKVDDYLSNLLLAKFVRSSLALTES